MTTLTLHQQAVQRIRDLLASNDGSTWTCPADLLADIMHYCEENFDDELETAKELYDDELRFDEPYDNEVDTDDTDTEETDMPYDPEDQYANEDEFDEEPPRLN